MAKNMTRKGLALGSGAALVVSGFVGVLPANAVINDNAVSLLPRTGTQYSMVVDNVFDLQTTISSTLFNGVVGKLKFLVEDADSAVKVDWNVGTTAATETDFAETAIAKSSSTVTVTKTSHGLSNGAKIIVKTGVAGLPVGEYTVANSSANAFDITTTGNTTALPTNPHSTAVLVVAAGAAANLNTYEYIKAADFASASVAGGISARETDGSFVVVGDTVANSVGANTVLRLVSTSATTKTVKVTAWVDEGAGNDTIDSTEIQSTQRTVTFVPWASAGAVLDLSQPIAGEATWKANIKFDSSINASQIKSGRVAIAVGAVDGGALKAGASGVTVSDNAFTAGVAATYSSTNNYWGLGTSGTAGVATVINYATADDDKFNAGFTYVAQVILDGAVFGSSVSKSTSSALADTVGAVTPSLGDNVRLISGQDYAVRVGTTSISALSKVTKNSVGVANAPVTVTVTRGVLDSASTITAGGKTLTSTTTAGLITFDTVTNAAGEVAITVANSQGKAGDKITVEVTQAGIGSTGTTTFEWLAVSNAAARVGSATSAGEDRVGITAGSTYTLNYSVADQFGAALTSNWRLLIEYTPIGNVSGAAQDAVVRSVPITSGAVSVSITDTSTIVGTYAVTAKLQRLVTSTGNYDTAVDTHTTTVHVQSNVTPAAVTVSETLVGTAALEAKDFKAVDLRSNRNQLAPGYTAAAGYTIQGVVTNASGAGLAGVNVTLSAPGVAFFVDGPTQTGESRDVYSVGSVVVTTNANGAYSVALVSQRAGKFKVTATVGSISASTTNDLVFPAADHTTGAALTLVAPSAVQPGSTFQVTAKLVDKYGNPVAADDATTNVDVSVSYTGPGIVFGSLPTKFATDGTLTFAVLLGTNDKGTATITVAYDGDNRVATNTSAFTVSKSVTVGAVAGVTGTSVKRTGDSVAVRVTGAKTRIVFNGVRVASRTTDGVLSRTLTLRAGRNVIQIVVDGTVVRTVRYTR